MLLVRQGVKTNAADFAPTVLLSAEELEEEYAKTVAGWGAGAFPMMFFYSFFCPTLSKCRMAARVLMNADRECVAVDKGKFAIRNSSHGNPQKGDK